MASVLLALLLRVLACVPLLKEWFLSFGIVATCPVIPDPVAGVVCLSLKLRCDLILIVGIVVQGSCSIHYVGTNCAYSASMSGILVSSSSSCLLQARAR
jgi:hypothetical protein